MTQPISVTAVFRSSPLRGFAMVVVAAAAGTTLLDVLLGVVTHHILPWRGLGTQVACTTAGAAIGHGLARLGNRRRPTWIRVSPLGLEIAHRGAPFLIAWTDIVTARVRRRRLVPVLEIIPTDLYALRVQLPSRDLPPVRDTALGCALVVDLSDFRPGARALSAALPHR
jgi:hypothetical protein